MSNNHPIIASEGRNPSIGEKATHVDLQQETCDRETTQVQRDCSALENRVIPISSLPNELLSSIFEHGQLHSMSRGSLPFEILVSHLNRRLRAVAIRTRLLWVKIEISLATPFDKVMAYLQRSGTFTIDLSVNIDTQPSPDSEHNGRSAALLYTCAGWAIVMSEMTRCRRFCARFGENHSRSLQDMIGSLHAVKAPHLEYFRIESLCQASQHDTGPYRKILNGGAPSLKTIWIDGWGLHQCLPPLTAITSLVLFPASHLMLWSDLREIISGSLTLTFLTIGDIFAEYLSDDFQSGIFLPSLQTLRISINEMDGSPFIDDVLMAISAPQLECLLIDHVMESDLMNTPQSYPQLQDTERFPHLRRLIISLNRDQKVSQEAWSTFFSVFPHITHFSLQSEADEVIWTEPLITTLAVCSMGPLILPVLATLSFNKICATTVTSLCHLVTMREAAGHQLRSLYLPATIVDDGTLADSLGHLRRWVEVKEYQLDDI